ncbi:MAG: UPF0149 family protein [Syntrophales bacterium]|nr:UPF0149 family protein [Syntrophales bacterium]
MMKLFTPKEQKNLLQILPKNTASGRITSLEALHGFLFGVVICPQLVMPSSWLPVIMGEEARFTTVPEMEKCMGTLFDVYNRMVSENEVDYMALPFREHELTKVNERLIRDWCQGLVTSIATFADQWEMADTDEFPDDLPEHVSEFYMCLGIVTALARPEEKDKMFINCGELEVLFSLPQLYSFLPQAVEYLQIYSDLIREEVDQEGPEDIPTRQDANIGRNDACPCGSGKKYKKCCGAH